MSELPNGWISTNLGQVVNYADNESADPTEMPSDAWLLELEDIERDTGKLINQKTVGERLPKSSKNRFHIGDVLYGKLRPYLNKVIRANQSGFCSSEIIAISPGLLDKNYLFYSMRSPKFIEYVNSVSHGMRMPRLGTQQARSAPVLLPPLAEQTRIAAKLDELLAQVDTLKARIDDIPALLKRFRQSVLAAAVSGHLTTEWRKHQKQKIEWEETNIDSVCASSFYGPRFGKGDYVNDGLPTIRTTDMTSKGKILITNTTPRVNIPKEKIENLKASDGDLLVTRTGSIGTMAVFRGNYEAIPSAYLIRFRFKESVSVEFIYNYLTSPKGQEKLGLGTTTTTQPNINARAIKSITLNLPPLEEQIEIVRRVEQLFAFADQLEARVKAAQTRIDRLTQSILAKAFRGELVAQDPNDEPASVLLERIKAQRAAEPKAKRGRGAAKLS